MGVSTNLFVTARKEDMFDLMPKLIKDINKWQRDWLVEYANRKGFDNPAMFLFRDKEAELNKHLKDFTNGIYSIHTHDFGSFTTNFTVNGEKRNLSINHSCSCEYEDIYDGDKIIFSLGCWGLSREIMMVVADSVKEFGDVYYQHNDYSDEWELLTGKLTEKI